MKKTNISALLLAALLLPGLYVAMATYHQEMIPTKLLLAIIESKREVPFDTVFEVVSEWFPEVRPERRTDFCLKVLSPAEAVFGKYSIDDRFESSPACHTLTVELTGFIQSYIEQYGV